MPRQKDWEDQPLADEFKPSMRDAASLAESLKAYSPRIIGGRKQYPFELYLESEGVVRFDEFGEMIIRKPMEYHRLSQVNSLREWKADKDQEAFFQAFPEEKVAFNERIRAMVESLRGMVLMKKVTHP